MPEEGGPNQEIQVGQTNFEMLSHRFVEEGETLREKIRTNPQTVKAFRLFQPFIGAMIQEQSAEASYRETVLDTRQSPTQQISEGFGRRFKKALDDATEAKKQARDNVTAALKADPTLAEDYKDITTEFERIAIIGRESQYGKSLEASHGGWLINGYLLQLLTSE